MVGVDVVVEVVVEPDGTDVVDDGAVVGVDVVDPDPGVEVEVVELGADVLGTVDPRVLGTVVDRGRVVVVGATVGVGALGVTRAIGSGRTRM